MSKASTTYLSHNLEAKPANDPVVVFLHGYGADEADLPDLISHLPRISWVSPRAPLSSGNGVSVSAAPTRRDMNLRIFEFNVNIILFALQN